MRAFIHAVALLGSFTIAAIPASAVQRSSPSTPSDLVPAQALSGRPADYSNGFGTNAANSTAVGRPIGPYGGYVVNQYGYGNYVSGPAGYGGYPAGSAGAEIWRQRERWKCENAPETC